MWQVEKYLLQVKQGPYYICTIFHQSLYQPSVKLLKHKKYHILTAELYDPGKSFDEKLYMCELCQKHICKNEIPFQTVCNKMALDPLPDELKTFKKLEKMLVSKRIWFKKIGIMHGKYEFSQINRSICNIPMEAADTCTILPRPAVSNELTVNSKWILNTEVMYSLTQFTFYVRPLLI